VVHCGIAYNCANRRRKRGYHVRVGQFGYVRAFLVPGRFWASGFRGFCVTTMQRREKRYTKGLAVLTLVLGLAAVLVGGTLAIAWKKGGAVPIHEIQQPLPTTQVSR
jgi:hypothetical protein